MRISYCFVSVKIKHFFLSLFFLGFLFSSNVVFSYYSRSQVHIVGSSTIFPFIATVAEEFARGYKTNTPIIESLGTGVGFRLFCNGVGQQTPDIVVASRKMTKAEVELCSVKGVNDIIELKLGRDAIVLGSLNNANVIDFGIRDLFYALSANIPSAGFDLQKNIYKNWKEIDSTFPDKKIQFYGPLRTSGTYETMVDLTVRKTCKSMQSFRENFLNDAELNTVCSIVRSDGVYVEVSTQDENLILQKMKQNDNIIGIFSYNFLMQNKDVILPNKINGVSPTYENILSGKYTLSRPLYLYIKVENIQYVRDLKNFIAELMSSEAIGSRGYLISMGLVVPKNSEIQYVKDLLIKRGIIK